jgi:tetratricopeptide (TPR) repeat protein
MKTEINFKGSKLLAVVISVMIFVFSVINIPHTINKLRADRHYKLAYFAFNKSEFNEALILNNQAINLNPDCSAYRYYEAMQVYNYCFENDELSKNAKHNLLRQVEDEINKAKEDLYYVNNCDGMLSLVYYEEGRLMEAEKLKDEVLEKDSINVNYRMKLTRYLLRENRLDEAKRNLNVILLIRPYERPANCLLLFILQSRR